ncbi:MAG: phosphotransferase family protein [Acidimicrobiales bacterium]
MQQPSGQLPAHMVRWIEEVTGACVTSSARQAGGGRKEAWLVVLRAGDGTGDRVFLRWDQSDPTLTGDPWTVRREASVYRALRDTAVPVAKLIAVHPTEEAMLLTLVHGENRFSRIDDPARATAVAKDFVRHLAALHRLDVGGLGLDVGTGDGVPDLVRAQLDEMDALIEFRGGMPEAVLGLALTWLREHVPDFEGPKVLVQGDTGPGNFMYEDDHVTAIVDWELAHLGDPMDDVAWLSLRAVQEPFTDLAARVAEYAELSGHPVAVDRLRYYRVLAEAKIMVMGHGLGVRARSTGPDGGGDPGARLIFGQLHRRLLVEALADVMGLELEPPRLPGPTVETERHALFGLVLDQLRNVVSPRVEDGFALQRIKGLARVIKYLEAADRLAVVFDHDELEDLADALGTRPETVAEGRSRLARAVRDRTIEPGAALRVVHRRVARDNELLREASGVLADRHYDPLPPPSTLGPGRLA